MRANKLFGILLTTIDNNDEIIILSDQNHITEEVKFLISLSYYQKEYPIKPFLIHWMEILPHLKII